MLKKYGASRDRGYKFRSFILEARENKKEKDNNDSDKLIEDENNINPK
jgi:hypothetical protein